MVVPGLLEPGDAIAQHDVHAVPLEEVRDDPRRTRVERGEDLVGQLDDGHVEPAMDEVLRHLEADEAAADTTACLAGRTVWNPEYRSIPARKLVPRSIHSRICLASGTVRTGKIPGRSIPGSGGRIEGAPGDSTSLS